VVHKLILHPREPERVPQDLGALRRTLEKLGFIGREIRLGGALHYLPGEHFLQLVTFLGCSPSVALEPPDGFPQGDAGPTGVTFCHVRIEESVSEVPRFIAGTDALAPRCPRCRSVLDRLRPMQQGAREIWSCPSCGHGTPLWALDWRQRAGFARFAIEIWNIHPFEAVPSDPLLAALSRTSRGEWEFFYAAQP
jgi:hypothetical protein